MSLWRVYLTAEEWSRSEPAHEIEGGTVNITPGGALTIIDDDLASHWYAPGAWYYTTDAPEEEE